MSAPATPLPQAPPDGLLPRLRAALFYALIALATLPFCAAALSLARAPHGLRWRVVTGWSRFALWCLHRVVGLDFRVLGRERLPDRPCVVACKHQSAWETLALQLVLPPHVWVLKRELLRIPLFGWGLAVLEPIAIDRGAPRQALRQVQREGAARLAAGRWLVIFPEGTRVAPGERRKYGQSAAALAIGNATPLVPIAHDAGRYWPRRGFLKRPGCITLSIGPPIATAGRSAAEVTAEAEAWIEAEVARLAADAPA